MGGGLDDYKPAMAMFGMQFNIAVSALLARAALVQGMNGRVLVVYRQAIATLVLTPIAYWSSGRASTRPSLGLRGFSLLFLASLIGVTINQNLYLMGLYLASSSIASAMGNLVPAITFLLAAIIGMEKINIRSLRSIAKLVGTMLCVGGAISMALMRGPKILNATTSGSGGENWLLGCLWLFLSSCCWSLWLILQVPVTTSYPDHLSLSAWMCFLATVQSAIVTCFLEQDLEAWKLHSYLEVICLLYAGVLGSGISFFVQAWCISRRGPLYSAMFSPLCTVIVTILAALFLHEELYIGSLISAVGVVAGLYVVLWGKAKEHKTDQEETDPKPGIDQTETLKIQIDESTCDKTSKIDLEEPLLIAEKSTEQI